MKHSKKFYWFMPVALTIFVSLPFVIVFLWNRLLPDLFGIQEISYWQAVGLFLLTRIFFGSFHSNHHSSEQKNHMHEKWLEMNEEERDAFIKRRKAHVHKHFFTSNECNNPSENQSN